MAYDATQARRIAEGLCKDCGAERGADGTSRSCRPCANKNSARASARKARLRSEWAAAGTLTCNNCGTSLDDAAFKQCGACREYARRWHHTCGKVRRNAKRGTGVCVSCPKSSTHGSNYCRDHWLENSLRRYGFDRGAYDAMWAKLEAQDFRCHYTGVGLVPGVNCSLDHRVPGSRGGSLLDPDNTVWCDRLINAFKNDLTEAEFVDRCRMVVARLG